MIICINFKRYECVVRWMQLIGIMQKTIVNTKNNLQQRIILKTEIIVVCNVSIVVGQPSLYTSRRGSYLHVTCNMWDLCAILDVAIIYLKEVCFGCNDGDSVGVQKVLIFFDFMHL
eukprot:TRINITY_DN20853_c0_g1_i8.p2 TRINITY_DN20853_c0_g1~~TRINITY_DN20853_c0_g1_i8.p2  ORF type:complete len:116 (+),score=2.59 TRINITY_DN20853_c0_g1_i8:155-502(+)